MPNPTPTPVLPSRYEDLSREFRARLRPERSLLAAVQDAYTSLKVSGGIRFLPVFGKSGSGKSCAAFELATHLPECLVVPLPRDAVESSEAFNTFVAKDVPRLDPKRLLVFVVDQYEEAVATRANLPSQFVERLSLLDRSEHARQHSMLFMWLTTSAEFQKLLVNATSRNQRILVAPSFALSGPGLNDWPSIIQETFEFHNGRALADFDVLMDELEEAALNEETLGRAMERIGSLAARKFTTLQDLSKLQVIMLWPVTDGLRITRIVGVTDARSGYKLDWNAFHRELNVEDRRTLPLHAYNRARLYFDMRLVPIAAADLHPLCRELEKRELGAPAFVSGSLQAVTLLFPRGGHLEPGQVQSPARARIPTGRGSPRLVPNGHFSAGNIGSPNRTVLAGVRHSG